MGGTNLRWSDVIENIKVKGAPTPNREVEEECC